MMKFSFEGTQDDLQALVRSLGQMTAPLSSIPGLRAPEEARSDMTYLGGFSPHPAAGGHIVDPIPPAMQSPGVSTGKPLTGVPGPGVPLEVASNPMESPKISGTNVPIDFFDKLQPNPEAWDAWVELVKLWLENFQCELNDDGRPALLQPNRLEALKDLGKGQWPIHILKWVSIHGSLQGAVFVAIGEIKNPEGRPGEPDKNGTHYQAELKLADDVAMTMVQVSHAAFPDLEGFYDHSTKWWRELSA